MTSILEGVGGWGIEKAWSLFLVILYHRYVHRRQIHCQMAVTKCDLMTYKHSRYRTRSGRSIAHLLTADSLWAFWYIKDTISGKFALFLTSSLCFGTLNTCFVPLYSKGSCCTYYIPCMPLKIDILPFSSMNLGYT